MAEPAFYKCKKCFRAWSRMQFKMQRNQPPQCPHCQAGAEHQGLDEERESQYMRDVYGPLVKALFGDSKKASGDAEGESR